MRSMRAVVVDEADQLLTGGYERDCLRVLDAFREGDRLRKAGAVCAELRISPEHFQELPRLFRRAAYEGACPEIVADHSMGLGVTHCKMYVQEHPVLEDED